MIEQGFNVIIRVGDEMVAGQLNVGLTRSQSPIDITNKIKGEWKESLSGLKTWSINCSGVYVKDKQSLSLLEDAFMNDNVIEVIIERGNKVYKGNALITNFPLNAEYNNYYKYTLSLLGDGALEEINNGN